MPTISRMSPDQQHRAADDQRRPWRREPRLLEPGHRRLQQHDERRHQQHRADEDETSPAAAWPTFSDISVRAAGFPCAPAW